MSVLLFHACEIRMLHTMMILITLVVSLSRMASSVHFCQTVGKFGDFQQCHFRGEGVLYMEIVIQTGQDHIAPKHSPSMRGYSCGEGTKHDKP